MAFGKKKPSQSEIDGVQYRRVPTWCIAIAEMQGGAAMAFYSLVGLMSYVASEGYGIALAVAGVILTATRWFDGIIDPFLAVWIDKLHTRFGKLRILMLLGLAIRSVAMLMLFVWFSGKTQSETARVLGTTQVQISRRERKILKEMRELLLQG